MSAAVWVAVALLGGAGALARLLLDAAISARGAGTFPLGTLAVNLSGALALGLLDGLAVTGTALTLAGTAVLGSYTTFSTWMLESQRLGEEGDVAGLWANLAVSLLAGLLAVWAGQRIGRAL